jgi:hypothetical protein
MGLEPERTSVNGWIDAGPLPPGRFVATTMRFAMMAAAERHGELIAHLAAKRRMLRKAQVVGI